MEFDRKKLNNRLQQLKQPKIRQKFNRYAADQGIFHVRLRHLRRFIAIIRLLNKSTIATEDMLDSAKWLRRHGYGRFNAVEPGNNLPLLIDGGKAVKLYCAYSAKIYLQFITRKMEIPFIEHMLQIASGE